MLAIFKREFRACFTGIIGWLFMAAILAMFGLYFYVYNLLSGYPYLSYVFGSMAFIMLIAVPILTMRIMSEDRHSRTDQLILTAPVPVWKIVAGKYLALAALYTIDMAIISITPLVLSLYGTVPMGENYTAILGFWLYGLACIAIGLFISGTTESQIISAVVCFVVLFIGYMMPNFCTLISEGGNIVTKILSAYDLYSRLGPFNAGTLDVGCVVYFITLILFFLFLAVQLIQRRRWSISVKRIGMGIFSIGTIIVVLAAAVLINFGISKIPTEYTSLDMTYNRMFELTDKTREYVAALDTDVTIYVMSAEGSTDTTLTETLSRYNDLSRRLHVEYITTKDDPNFYQKYTDEAPSDSSLIVVSGSRSRVIDYEDIYEYSYDYTGYSRSVDAYDAEGQITSAIGYVTLDSGELPAVYILSGHNEVGMGSSFNQALTKANIEVNTLNLLQEDKVPEDCQLLIIYGPMADISSDDLGKIEDYLADGGTVMLNTSYDAGSLANVDKLLEKYGITRTGGIVMDDAGHSYSNIAYYLLPEISDNTYTERITNGYVFAPYASGLTIDEDNADYEYTEILASGDSAYAATVDSEGNERDIEGPFLVGVAARIADETGTLVVFGSIDIFEDEADGIVAGSNLALFNGVVGRHVSESELDLPVIPSKPYTVDNLVINSAAGLVTGIMIMIVLPVAMLAAGIVIWAVRRKR
ncbi:MAG: Gldg family protein [Lachnospiraceae bacterium]|nr:Gldg family protein [Lachnospiraceae bacterium]